MMNPTIETDLVGDLIEISDREYISNRDNAQPGYWHHSLVGRGRVRAVTADTAGTMLLWLEVIDEECECAFFSNDPRAKIGEIVCVRATDHNHMPRTIRLIAYSK